MTLHTFIKVKVRMSHDHQTVEEGIEFLTRSLLLSKEAHCHHTNCKDDGECHPAVARVLGMLAQGHSKRAMLATGVDSAANRREGFAAAIDLHEREFATKRKALPASPNRTWQDGRIYPTHISFLETYTSLELVYFEAARASYRDHFQQQQQQQQPRSEGSIDGVDGAAAAAAVDQQRDWLKLALQYGTLAEGVWRSVNSKAVRTSSRGGNGSSAPGAGGGGGKRAFVVTPTSRAADNACELPPSPPSVSVDIEESKAVTVAACESLQSVHSLTSARTNTDSIAAAGPKNLLSGVTEHHIQPEALTPVFEVLGGIHNMLGNHKLALEKLKKAETILDEYFQSAIRIGYIDVTSEGNDGTLSSDVHTCTSRGGSNGSGISGDAIDSTGGDNGGSGGEKQAQHLRKSTTEQLRAKSQLPRRLHRLLRVCDHMAAAYRASGDGQAAFEKSKKVVKIRDGVTAMLKKELRPFQEEK